MVWIEVNKDRFYYPSVVDARKDAILFLNGLGGRTQKRVYFYKSKGSRYAYASIEKDNLNPKYAIWMHDNCINLVKANGEVERD